MMKDIKVKKGSAQVVFDFGCSFKLLPEKIQQQSPLKPLKFIHSR